MDLFIAKSHEEIPMYGSVADTLKHIHSTIHLHSHLHLVPVGIDVAGVTVNG